MASFIKFNAFVANLANGKFNLATDTLKVYLTNTAPDAAADAVKADLAEISTGNGYTGPVTATVTSSSQTGGTYKLVLADPPTITASGGSVGPFQWAVLYSDTAANDELIGAWNYGSAITLANGESFAVDFDASTGVLTLA